MVNMEGEKEWWEVRVRPLFADCSSKIHRYRLELCLLQCDRIIFWADTSLWNLRSDGDRPLSCHFSHLFLLFYRYCTVYCLFENSFVNRAGCCGGGGEFSCSEARRGRQLKMPHNRSWTSPLAQQNTKKWREREIVIAHCNILFKFAPHEHNNWTIEQHPHGNNKSLQQQ